MFQQWEKHRPTVNPSEFLHVGAESVGLIKQISRCEYANQWEKMSRGEKQQLDSMVEA